MPVFYFEQLRAYQLSLDWADSAETLRKVAKKHVPSSLLTQLHRAATSVPLNVAEAAGRLTNGEQRHFLAVARGSIFECKAILDLLERRKFLDKDLLHRYSSQLKELQGLVTGLITAVQKCRHPMPLVKIEEGLPIPTVPAAIARPKKTLSPNLSCFD